MHDIDSFSLLYMIIPIIPIVIFMIKWDMDVKTLIYATIRMVVQLIAIGYVLVFIFSKNHWFMAFLIVLVMVSVASWISLRVVKKKNKNVFFEVVASIAIPSALTLSLVIFVIDLDPWYEVRYLIPLAGMIVSSSMNKLSQYMERFEDEMETQTYEISRKKAFNAALIPLLNALFAVGLVSLPGMMTGQILSGISPLIAVKYQMVVMFMMLISGSFSIILYDFLTCRNLKTKQNEKN